MGKVRRLFVCSSCGRTSGQWAGRCASCAAWGTISEQIVSAGASGAGCSAGVAAAVVTLGPQAEERRIGTGFAGVDRVLGGGLVPGSVVLLAGAPGIGKSTLLLQLASRLTSAGHPCLIASGEEGRAQVAARARRLGLDGERLSFAPGRELGDVLATAEAAPPAVLIVDSVHTIRDSATESLVGGPAQVRGCVDALVGLAKRLNMTVLLVGHVTKAGDVAGPRTVEHAVDVLLSFEGDARSGRRVLVGGKNRFGPEGEVAWFEMGPGGLVEKDGVVDVSGDPEPGCAVALALAGRRALAIEVQALVVPTDGPPRRQVSGLDARRFHILAAVADRATGARLVRSELFGASAGGLRLDEPGVDLAVAAALVSAGCGAPPPPATGFVGEVSLSGAIRPVGALEQRASAAEAAGLERIVCARADASRGARAARGVRLEGVDHLREAVSWSLAKRAVPALYGH